VNVTFASVKQEVEELVQFLTSDNWPYHGVENPAESESAASIGEKALAFRL